MVPEFSRFSAALTCLYRPANFWTFPTQLFEALKQLLDADMFNYNEFGPNNHLVALGSPQGPGDAYAPQFAAHCLEHPVITKIANNEGAKDPVQLSHPISLQRWRRTALWNEAFRPLDLHYQLGALIRRGPMLISFSCSRALKDFSKDEYNLVREFMPHVEAALKNAQMFSAPGAGRIGNCEWAIVNLDGTVLEHSPAAIRILEKFGALEGGGRFADTVRRWFQYETSQLRKCFQPSLPQPLVLKNEHGEMTMGVVPEDAMRAKVWISEKCLTNDVDRLRSLGLTARQAEVLFWAAQGKRNAEIATILGAAPRTVAKHLESIYLALRVETRAAATMVAMDALRP